MINTRNFTYGKLQPTTHPELAVEAAGRLPVGVSLAAGTVLAISSIAARAEVRTLTITGTPTGGTFTISYTADKVYSTSALAYNVSLADVKTALERIFGTGNMDVTGTPVTSYVVTFKNALDKIQIDGTFAVTNTFTGGSTPSAAWARTTQGSAGPGQYVAYDDAGSNGAATAKAILARAYTSDPLGGFVSEWGPTNQPFSPPIFLAGYFLCSDLTGLDANGVTDLGKLVVGNAYSDTGAVLKM